MRWLRSFQGKLIFFFVANAAVILLAFLYLTNEIVERVSSREIRDSLEAGRNTVVQFLRDREERLRLGASLMAADYGFKQAYASDDPGTITSALVNLRQRIQAGFVTLVELDGAVTASTATHGQDAKAVLGRLVSGDERGQDGTSWSATAVLDGKLTQVVFVPFLAPELVKWTAVGFEIETGLAENVRRVSGNEIVITDGAGPGRRAHASTLGEEDTRKVLKRLERETEGRWRAVDGREFHFLASEAGPAMLVSVLKDSTAITEALGRARALSLGLFVALLLASLLAARFIAGLVSRPIKDITDKSVRLANGQHDVDLTTDLGDESLRELSRSLQRMTTALRSEVKKKLDALREAREHMAQVKAVNRELKRKSDESSLLVRAVALTKEGLRPSELFERTLDLIVETFSFDRVAILKLAHGDKNLEPEAVRTREGADPKFERVRNLSTGLSLLDLKVPELRYKFHHMPFEWMRALADDTYVYYERPMQDDTLLAIPIRNEAKAHGFLHVIDNSGRPLGESDIAVLSSVADLLASELARLAGIGKSL